MEIASALGISLVIDATAHKLTFWHYARVLVDTNFSRHLFYETMVESDDFAFLVEVEYEWLPKFCSHCQILTHSVVNCRWLHPEKDLNKDNDNTKKVQDKGKNIIMQQKPQTKIWQPRDNLQGIGSSLAFAKPVSEITAPVAATNQPPEQNVCPMVVAPVETYVAQSETCREALSLDSSRHAHSDKSAFTYHLALENITDDVSRSNDVESTSILNPMLKLQHVLVPLTVDVQQLEDRNVHVDSDALVVAAAGNSPAIQSNPFVTVILHRCPMITKDVD